MVDGLRRAFGFLTLYPLRASDTWTPETLGSSMVYYPLVGTFIGLALWGLALLLSLLFPPSVVPVLVLAGSLLVTGGLHMDGLGGLVDGVSGGYNCGDGFRVFQDPHGWPLAVARVVVSLSG